MASTSTDPMGSAIAAAGLSDEPASSHSEPIKHATPLDGIETGRLSLEPGDTEESHRLSRSSSSEPHKRCSTARTQGMNGDGDGDEDYDEEDDLVMFDTENASAGPLPSRYSGDAFSAGRFTYTETDKKHARTSSIASSSHASEAASTPMAVLGRASLESVGFSYSNHLLPLSLSSGAGNGYDDDDEEEADTAHIGQSQGRPGEGGELGERSSARRARTSAIRKDERRVGLIDGIALTVGLQIGSGIFSSPGIVTYNTGSIGASIVVWLVSGALAWTGASSFAELGAAIPLNGGAQAYLNYSFGPLSGYLFSWSAITCLKPSSAAIMATIFGEYLARILYHTTSKAAGNPHEQGLEGIPGWSIKLLAILVIVVVSVLNALSAKLGTRMQVLLTVLKLGALVAVPILAAVQAARGMMPEASAQAFSSFDNLFQGSSSAPSGYALALYSGLWAFDGWDQSSYVAGEMKNAGRDLPRVIHVSLSIVVVIFLTSVVSYFVVLAPTLVAQTNTVALDFGSAILGTTGGMLFALIVALSCFGALNGQIYTTSRFVYAAGREGHLPAMFGRIHPRTRTPLAATMMNLVLVVLFIVFGSGFASLVSFYGVCAWSFYFVTVLGLLHLRIKEPNLERPYQTWLATPIAFSAVALFLLFMPIFSAPLEALAAFGFILMGVPMYYVTQASGVASLPRIPGLGKLVGAIRRCTGMSRQQDTGRGGDGSVLFGRRKVRRLAKGSAAQGANGSGLRTNLEDLHEDEEEGDEEEAVEMLPRQDRGSSPRPSDAR